jgi:hypothetical protein
MSEGKTPAQAAYEATVAQAVIDGHDIGEYAAYPHLSPWRRERWEAAAQAAIGAAPDFATAFHDDVTELRALVAEILEAAIADDGAEDRIARWRERAGLEALT